ncbi:hypothetical protein ACVW1C_006088 [Bradyrhizobium sp. USDA 4011]
MRLVFSGRQSVTGGLEARCFFGLRASICLRIDSRVGDKSRDLCHEEPIDRSPAAGRQEIDQ